MADVPGGEEKRPLIVLGSGSYKGNFHDDISRCMEILRITSKLETYASDIIYFLEEGIVTLEELNAYFRGDQTRENLQQLLLKLKMYLDIETLIKWPKTDDGYEMAMQRTIETAFTHLEDICKRFLDSPKRKYFRN